MGLTLTAEGGMVVDSSPARGRLALNAATSCCATKAPAVEACVVAVRCRVSRRADHGRREPAVESLAIQEQKNAQVPSIVPRLGPRRLLETSIPQIRPPARWHEDVRRQKQSL